MSVAEISEVTQAASCVGENHPRPLVALFAAGERVFAAEFDRRMRETEFCALSLAHSRNILRHLGSGPRRASQLVQASDVSKQALSQQIAHLERNGYISVEPDPTDHRARILSLTDKGVSAQRLVKRLFAEIEADWAELVGESELDSVRTVLTRLIQGAADAGC